MPRSFKRESEGERGRRLWEARVRAVDGASGAPVVEGWLARGGVRVVGASARSGRTAWAARLGAAVSRGEPFAGRATRRTNVLYLAADDLPQEWAHDVEPRLGEKGGWLCVAFGRFDLDREAGLWALRARCERGVGLVVVDTLRTAVDRSAARGLRGLGALAREKGVAALVVDDGRR